MYSAIHRFPGSKNSQQLSRRLHCSLGCKGARAGKTTPRPSSPPHNRQPRPSTRVHPPPGAARSTDAPRRTLRSSPPPGPASASISPSVKTRVAPPAGTTPAQMRPYIALRASSLASVRRFRGRRLKSAFAMGTNEPAPPTAAASARATCGRRRRGRRRVGGVELCLERLGSVVEGGKDRLEGGPKRPHGRICVGQREGAQRGGHSIRRRRGGARGWGEQTKGEEGSTEEEARNGGNWGRARSSKEERSTG